MDFSSLDFTFDDFCVLLMFPWDAFDLRSLRRKITSKVERYIFIPSSKFALRGPDRTQVTSGQRTKLNSGLESGLGPRAHVSVLVSPVALIVLGAH